MTDDDFRKIRVGDHEVGIIGLERALNEVSAIHDEKSDDEIKAALIEQLRKNNYIPASAERTYETALIREYSKFVGRPHEEAPQVDLRVVVFGPGCFLCTSLEQSVMQVLNEMALPASLEHVTDPKEIAKYGITRMPALMINDKLVAAGTTPPPKKIREWLAECATEFPKSKE